MLQTRLVKPTTVIVHHSATKDSGTVSWGAIEEYHTKTMGWSDIGYHAGVEMVDGKPYAMFGRPEWAVAAAVRENLMNTLALHVCVVGDYDVQTPSEELLKVLAERVIKPWLTRYRIPVENIKTHHQFADYKTCPGKLFPMDKLRKMCSYWILMYVLLLGQIVLMLY